MANPARPPKTMPSIGNTTATNRRNYPSKINQPIDREQRRSKPMARRRKKKSSKLGHCDGTSLLVTAMLCLLLMYGISMTVYFLLLSHSHLKGHKKNAWLLHHRGMSKEEQLQKLNRLQLEKLQQKPQKQPRVVEEDKDDDLEMRRRNHKMQSIMRKHEIASTFQRKYPKMIHFLHIHKSAGTFLCKRAFQNKMAADYGRNCNVRDDQQCCGDYLDAQTTNETQRIQSSIHFAQTAPFDFVASERELSGPMLPEYYEYVVALRNSQARYKSHWQHLVRDAEKRKRDVKSYRDAITQGKVPPKQKQTKQQRGGYRVSAPIVPEESPQDNDKLEKQGWIPYVRSWMHWMHGNAASPLPNNLWNSRARWVDTGEDPRDDPLHWNLTVVDQYDGSIHPVGNYTKWIHGQPDNYNLRMICGSPCLKVPKYQITRDLFEFTLQRLWVNFSHVLFVENMDASFARFAQAYGWETTYVNEYKSQPKAAAAKNLNPLSPFASDPYMTALDDALYEFALRKYNATPSGNASLLVWESDYPSFANQDLVERYFRYGPVKNCTNPCCGYCSKW